VYSLPGCRPTGAGANTESRQVTVPIQSESVPGPGNLRRQVGLITVGERRPILHYTALLHYTVRVTVRLRSAHSLRRANHAMIVVQHPLTPGRAAAQTTTVLKPQQTALSEPNRLSSAVVSPNPTSAVRESVIRSLFTCQKCAFASTKPAPLGENTRATTRARRHSSTVSARALALSTAGRLAACSTASSLSLSM